jgi:sulfatase modifying factor 1
MTNRTTCIRVAVLSSCCLLAVTAPAQVLSPVPMTLIDRVGNPADTNGVGAVAETFRLGTYEVTNAQYVLMLDAVAASDPHGLYDTLMTSSDRGGILRSGIPGAYLYSTKPDFDDKPVNGVTWYDSARFCNWLHNGMPTGAQGPATTEDGAYNLSLPGAFVERKVGALWFLPSNDEWYKAAYYDPVDPGADAGGTPDYWLYPTRSDAQPSQATADAVGDVTNPGPDIANHSKGADWNGENGNVTTVGGTGATSPFGLFDLGGNINEVTETLGTPIPPNPPAQPEALPTRLIRGGDFANSGALMASPTGLVGDLNMAAEGANIGFRVGSLEPWEDLGGALVGTAGEPVQQGLGSLIPGALLRLTLTDANPASLAFLIAGFSRVDVPFLGGTLVPDPLFISPAASTGPAGEAAFALPWPSGVAPGTGLITQFWIVDQAGPQGFSASNAIRKVTP